MKAKKMRVFPPEMQDYEKVYTNKRYTDKFKPERLLQPEGFQNLKEYEETLRDFFKRKSISLWIDMVQTQWLFDNFKYIGANYVNKVTSQGVQSNLAFNIFVLNNVGSSHGFVKSSFYFNKVVSYFDELFPKFMNNNPLKNPELYQYPFKNITIDYMSFIYQMPERMDILRYADEKDMKYNDFLDFVINYIGKYNEMEKKNMFMVIKPRSQPIYVKKLRK